jgi:hypothetical protein
VAYQSGNAADRKAVLDALDRIREPVPPPADWPAGYGNEQRI